MTPYDAARTLFLAICKQIDYTLTPRYDAVTKLQQGTADCGGFSSLFVASARSIGIPARAISGYWKGTNQWHVKAEFFFPGAGWLPADGSITDLWHDSTGTYAYMFGYDPTLNEFVAVSRGADHRRWDFSVKWLQVGWFFYSGNAMYDTWSNDVVVN